MESLKSFILFLFGAVVLVYGISFILAVFYVVIGVVYRLFSSPKCPNCAKAIRRKAIRCPRCRSSLTEEKPQEEINPELYARVKAFVAEQWLMSEEELTPDTLLADDLGIAGDDGYELLEAFCEEFEIQNRNEIDHTEYFGTEGCNPLEMYVLLYDLVFNREKRKGSDETALTLRDLVKSAEAKKWIPPEAT